MGGRSGGSSAPTETKVVNTDLPEYVQPYFERSKYGCTYSGKSVFTTFVSVGADEPPLLPPINYSP